MKKSELDKMVEFAKNVSEDSDPNNKLLGMIVVILGEQLVHTGEIKRELSELGPKLNATAKAIAELEGKIDSKIAVTRYDFGEKKT